MSRRKGIKSPFVLKVTHRIPELPDVRIGDRVVVEPGVEVPMSLVRDLPAERAVITAWNAGKLEMVTQDGPTISQAVASLHLAGKTRRAVAAKTKSTLRLVK